MNDTVDLSALRKTADVDESGMEIVLSGKIRRLDVISWTCRAIQSQYSYSICILLAIILGSGNAMFGHLRSSESSGEADV